jgi:hypothetical protein
MGMRGTTQTTNHPTHNTADRHPVVSLSECGNQHRIFIDWNLPWRTMTPTPWSIVLPEKLAGPQLVKEFHAFYGTWRFITSFTSIHHMSQIDSVHTSPPYFLKIHFNIILPSTPRSSKWPLCLRSRQQNPVRTSPVSNTCHTPRPSHSSLYDYPNNIWWGVHLIKLLVT